ncbi:MAG TPA: LamG-like jellyroll fold domain-containing protein [Nocardioidaceae bacterium]|nr:LamG-like jellyroll fold domain-containing protein [Nocardioidaceae bacterium]
MRISQRSSTCSALIAAAVGAVLCAPLAAGPADAATTTPKLRASAFQFMLTFDHRESLKTGTRVVDASGHGHAGVVMTHGGRITAKPGVSRRAAQFPPKGRAIVQIANGKGLNPRHRSFVFGGALRVGAKHAVRGSNIVQKGFYNQAGGQYKLQLAAGGVPVCVVFGDAGRIKTVANRGVANGHWHRVSCARTPTGVVVWIDGRRAGSTAGLTGRIANDAPINIGGKKVTAGNKQFRGRVDNVYMRFVPTSR